MSSQADELPRPVALANPDRVRADELEVIERLLQPVGFHVPPLPLLGNVIASFDDGQSYPVIAAVPVPDEEGWARDRVIVIRQMPALADRYVVQTVHPDASLPSGWCCERSRYRVDYNEALVILVKRLNEVIRS